MSGSAPVRAAFFQMNRNLQVSGVEPDLNWNFRGILPVGRFQQDFIIEGFPPSTGWNYPRRQATRRSRTNRSKKPYPAERLRFEAGDLCSRRRRFLPEGKASGDFANPGRGRVVRGVDALSGAAFYQCPVDTRRLRRRSLSPRRSPKAPGAGDQRRIFDRHH
jgi:hypothetical protein